MKNFSTAASAAICILAFTCSSVALPAAAAAPDTPLPPAAKCNFLPNAPDQHLVVNGDTLWDISGKFLQNPWCWPQVWGLNRDEIRNPHWIYPGQVIYFDRVAGRLRLGVPNASMPVPSNNDELGTVRLSPQIRMQSASAQPIPAIRPDVIEPFLTQALIMQEDLFKDAPVIVAAPEGRLNLMRGDQAYVRGDLKEVAKFQVFRPGRPLKDPVTGEVIAQEAAYLGIVRLDREAREAGEAHRFTVADSREEMGVRDLLLPIPPAAIINYMPHVPAQRVDARIVSLYGGGNLGGESQVVAINRGKEHGLDVGAVLELQSLGPIIRDVTNDNKPIKLPNQKYGTLFVFRIFDKLSYALIMQVTDVVKVGDLAVSPE